MNRVERVQALRRSNAAGRHLDKRTKRLRDRGTQKRAAISEQRNSSPIRGS
jgi:hypothetical protein